MLGEPVILDAEPVVLPASKVFASGRDDAVEGAKIRPFGIDAARDQVALGDDRLDALTALRGDAIRGYLVVSITILPKTWRSSSSRCASPTDSSGSVRAITGRSCPCATSRSTVARSARVPP
jgi:hypothetical protein